MDSLLHRCWLEATAPFDGVTVSDAAEDEAPISTLRDCVIAVTGLLQARFPDSTLHVLDDWHDHDGFVDVSTTVTWADLRSHLTTLEAFLFFRTGESWVSKGVYPRDRQFYLRVTLDADSADDAVAGTLDVTVPRSLVGVIEEAFRKAGMTPRAEPAKKFFDAREG